MNRFAILPAVVGVLMFAFLAWAVTEGRTQAFDRNLILAMAPIGSPLLHEAARNVTALGSSAVLILVTAITGGFLWLDGKKRTALFLCGSVAGGFLISSILKDAFHRHRPDLVPHGDYISNFSFPSGHSMMSAATYLTLGALLAQSQQNKRLKAYVLTAAALLTFLIGVTRVYLGVHWPTDVLAGWTAGTLWALLISQFHRATERRTK